MELSPYYFISDVMLSLWQINVFLLDNAAFIKSSTFTSDVLLGIYLFLISLKIIA